MKTSLSLAGLILAAASIAVAEDAAKTPATRPTTQPASHPTTGPATMPTTAPAVQWGKPITTEINAGKMIEYPTDLAQVRAYLVTPKGTGPHPAVVLCHDIFGMTGRIKKTAEELGRQGYVVIVPDLYSRQTEIKQTDEGLDAKTAYIAYESMPDTQAVSDLKHAVNYLIKEKLTGAEGPVATVGEDMGGAYALFLAGTDLRIKGAVNYYGRMLYVRTSKNRPVSPIESLFNLQAPVLSFYGEIDPQCPPEHISALRSRLRNAPSKVGFEVITYPNVGHSFLNETRKGYNKDAAEDARKRTRDFLAKVLRAEPEPEE